MDISIKYFYCFVSFIIGYNAHIFYTLIVAINKIFSMHLTNFFFKYSNFLDMVFDIFLHEK